MRHAKNNAQDGNIIMSTIKIVAELEVKPEIREELMPVLKELVEKSRAEEANISYDLTESLEKPGHFFVIEHWASAEGIEKHGATPHFQAFVTAVQGRAEKLAITKLKQVF